MKITKSIAMFQYRMNLRKTLQKSTYDHLKVTQEELQREFERRNKKNAKSN